jgi:hypothetical protein
MGMRDWKDRLGIFASALCAVHCAATPILVATLPTLQLTEWMADPRFHQSAAAICCGLVALAIAPSIFRFRDFRLLGLTSTGLGLILTAAFAMPENCCSTELSRASLAGPANSHAAADHDHDHDHDHIHHDHPPSSSSDSAASPAVSMAGLAVAQPWMTPIGGFFLILAHGLNIRRKWKESCDANRCCSATVSEELPPLRRAS